MDDGNINREVLYGSSGTPIPIEETPEIPMDMPQEPQSQVPPPPPMPTVSRGSPVLVIFILIMLVGAGVIFFPYMKPFFSGINRTKAVTQVPTPTPAVAPATPTPVDPFAGWKTGSVAGVSYKLPPEVVAPSCDVAGCISQGSNLPGGTRLTISPKTVTQSLSSLKGAVVTDVSGTAFTSHDAILSGHTAIEYTGTFSGRTSGGYGFTQMHGFMIEVTPTLTLEINHFTPVGASVDWDRDDTLFTQIISTISFTAQTPILTTAPVPATPSGY